MPAPETEKLLNVVLTASLLASTLLEEVIEAILLFHSGSPWNEAKRARWEQLVGNRDATTRQLCNYLREVQAIVVPEEPAHG